MKPTLLILVAALVAGSAAAADQAPPASKPASASAAKPTPAKGSARDAHAFCYLADQAYSEGAVVDGRECRRRPSADVFAQDKQPLSWQEPVREAR